MFTVASPGRRGEDTRLTCKHSHVAMRLFSLALEMVSEETMWATLLYGVPEVKPVECWRDQLVEEFRFVSGLSTFC